MPQTTKTAKERYDERTAVRISLKLNRNTDSDILARLADQKNKQGCIKTLIRAGIKAEEEN